MTSKNTDSGDSFERSSEQAAKLVGQFVNMANSFGQSVKESMNAAVADVPGDNSDAIRQSGQYVHRMRTAAGYSVEDFADAMGIDREHSRKIDAAENGHAPFPREWLQNAADILGVKDPLEFYSNFSDCYPNAESTVENNQSRARQLASIFEDDSALETLTDAQFKALLNAMRKNYQTAKELLVL